MKNVTISVPQLLEHLRVNREKHIADYAEAMDVYRDLLIDKLTSALNKACAKEDVSHHIEIDRPTNYVKSYDDAIAMLEWNVETQVTLDQSEFKQFVQDEWAWTRQFGATASMYKGMKGGL